MRFFLGAIAFVIGLSLSAIGLVDQLENQPIDLISVSQELQVPTTYVYIPNRVLTAYPGQIQVSAKDSGQVFIGLARETDIQGWLGDSQNVELRLNLFPESATLKLAEIEHAGTGDLLEPIGSDIFRTTSVEKSTAWVSVPEGNELGVLIATTGLAMAPREVKITWDLPNEAIPVSPITQIGLLLMMVGAALAIWEAIRSNRKSRPGRTGRGNPKKRNLRKLVGLISVPKLPARKSGRRAAKSIGFIGIASLSLSLTACAPEYVNPILTPSPSAGVGILTPVMNKSQLERILEEITSAVALSDQDLDRETLETRVSGPALSARRAAYNLARRTEDKTDGPSAILSTPIQLFLPSATDTWPRSVMVVTGTDRLQMLVLRQDSAREQFKLYQYMDLLPGITFPDVAAETVGGTAIKEDSKFLLIAPDDLALAVGDLLNNGADSGWNSIVDGANQYITDVSAVQTGLSQTLTNANLDFVHKITKDAPVLLASAEGGALVGLYMTDTYTIIPKLPGDAVAITGDEALLLGAGGSSTGIETRYGAMLLFHVPQAGSTEKVTLLGATQQLLATASLGAR